MSDTKIIITGKKPTLKNAILVEGLPGIGYVGRNAVAYLIEELGAVKFAELSSHHFPPVVLIDAKKDGKMVGLKNEFYHIKAQTGTSRDIVVLVGDSQSIDSLGHYEIVETVLDFAKELGIKEIITTGGFATGELVERAPKVFGAGVDMEYAKSFEKNGVKFKDANVGQIIGASGLLISMGHERGMKGVCLMGETSGMLLSDPKATEAVLEAIVKYLGIKIDMTKIDKRVKEIEAVIKKIESLHTKMAAGSKPGSDGDHLGYIG
ncbi:MAG: proteasome assembly chaperone family protein [Candidatus Aenigmarchaeota archaeon]|nr:proteasome assembly chaperone family protein [Candidatus Aenigmarchaeota archaeon]